MVDVACATPDVIDIVDPTGVQPVFVEKSVEYNGLFFTHPPTVKASLASGKSADVMVRLGAKMPLESLAVEVLPEDAVGVILLPDESGVIGGTDVTEL